MTNKVLILFAHPSEHRSEVNRPLFRASQNIEGVTTVDLYREYPDYRINIDREQKRLREHDIIVFMFPLYWYSTPALLKEWQDLVLEYGFAYGHEGTALHGKKFMCALTAGGAESAYREQGYNHFPIRDLLRPLEQTARLCGMDFLPPFALFSSRNAVEQDRIKEHTDQWRQLLLAMRDNRVYLEFETDCPKINHNIDNIIRKPS